VWDGLFISAAELLMCQPGIVALHTLTSLNALYYASKTTGDEHNRKLLLLQAAAFLPLFREAMKARGKIGAAKIDGLSAPAQSDRYDVESVFGELSKNKASASAMAYGLMKSDPDAARSIVDAGRRLIFAKGTDAHDYKFSEAVLEDYTHIAAPWRDRFLAASLYWMKGSGAADSSVAKRTRAALG
jgi:hypothetical protein